LCKQHRDNELTERFELMVCGKSSECLLWIKWPYWSKRTFWRAIKISCKRRWWSNWIYWWRFP
jgi:hypothetical protein